MKKILFVLLCLFSIPSMAYDTTTQVVTMLMLTDDMSNNDVKSTEVNQQNTTEKEKNDLTTLLIAISILAVVGVLRLGIEAIDEAYDKKHRKC